MPKTLIINETELTAGGGTVNLSVDDYIDLYRLYTSGAVTLTSPYTIQSSGTAERGMEYLFHYTGNLDFDGNAVTVMGATIPEDLEAVNMYIRAYYTGSAWEVTIAPDFESSNFITSSMLGADSVDTSEIASGAVEADEINSDAVITAKILDSNVTTAKIADDAITTDKILDSNVTTPKLADGAVTITKLEADATKGVFTVDTSYETGELGVTKVYFPFDATIDSAYYVVAKAIEATDSATVAFDISGSAMTPATNVNSAGEVRGSTKLITFSGGNAISASQLLELTSTKTTAGGKLTWTISYTKT